MAINSKPKKKPKIDKVDHRKDCVTWGSTGRVSTSGSIATKVNAREDDIALSNVSNAWKDIPKNNGLEKDGFGEDVSKKSGLRESGLKKSDFKISIFRDVCGINDCEKDNTRKNGSFIKVCFKNNGLFILAYNIFLPTVHV